MKQTSRTLSFRCFLSGLVVFVNLSVRAQDVFLQESKDSVCRQEQRLFDENLKYYRLVNQLNEKGETVSCHLCFKPLPEPINEPDVYVACFGRSHRKGNVYHSMHRRNG